MEDKIREKLESDIYEELRHFIGNASELQQATGNVMKLVKANQKFLTYEEVHKLFQKHIQWNDDDTVKDIQIIDLEEDILRLAIKPIDKDRIKDILWNNIMGKGFCNLTVNGIKTVFNTIASEILNEGVKE